MGYFQVPRWAYKHWLCVQCVMLISWCVCHASAMMIWHLYVHWSIDHFNAVHTCTYMIVYTDGDIMHGRTHKIWCWTVPIADGSVIYTYICQIHTRFYSRLITSSTQWQFMWPLMVICSSSCSCFSMYVVVRTVLLKYTYWCDACNHYCLCI